MKWVLSFCWLFYSFVGWAHQPDLSSTILAEVEQNSWILEIRAALTAFEYEVETTYGKDAYTTPEEFKDLLVEHVQKNLSILFDGNQQVLFEEPYVKLGHETSIVFKAKNIPENINTLQVQNSSFKDIAHNQSALVILKKGFLEKKITLTNQNMHSVALRANNSTNTFEVYVVQTQSKYLYLYLAIGAGLLVFMVLLGRKILKGNKSTNISSWRFRK